MIWRDQVGRAGKKMADRVIDPNPPFSLLLNDTRCGHLSDLVSAFGRAVLFLPFIVDFSPGRKIDDKNG
jgi:hypothetical protein